MGETDHTGAGGEPVALWRRRLRRLVAIWAGAAAALLAIHVLRESEVFLRHVLAPVRVLVVAIATVASWHALGRRAHRDRRHGDRRAAARRAEDEPR